MYDDPRGYFTGPSLRESKNDSHMASETWQLTEISVDLENCLRFLGFPYLVASDYGYNPIQFLQLCCKQSTTVSKALAKYKAVNLFLHFDDINFLEAFRNMWMENYELQLCI